VIAVGGYANNGNRDSASSEMSSVEMLDISAITSGLNSAVWMKGPNMKVSRAFLGTTYANGSCARAFPDRCIGNRTAISSSLHIALTTAHAGRVYAIGGRNSVTIGVYIKLSSVECLDLTVGTADTRSWELLELLALPVTWVSPAVVAVPGVGEARGAGVKVALRRRSIVRAVNVAPARTLVETCADTQRRGGTL
jgi:hypothetical protein